MTWGAIGAAGVSAVGSYFGGQSAKKGQGEAASTIERSKQEALRVGKEQYTRGRGLLGTYQQAGQEALGTYQGMLSSYQPTELPQFTGEVDLESDPGYQFRKEQGLESLDRMMAKGGKRFSGERGMALQDYGQRAASQEYGAAYGRSLQQYGTQYQRAMDMERQQVGQMGRYAGLASMGQQTAGQMANLGANYAQSYANINMGAAQQIGQAQMGAGQAQAAGYMGVANAIGGGIAGYNYNQGYGGGGATTADDWSGFDRGL